MDKPRQEKDKYNAQRVLNGCSVPEAIPQSLRHTRERGGSKPVGGYSGQGLLAQTFS